MCYRCYKVIKMYCKYVACNIQSDSLIKFVVCQLQSSGPLRKMQEGEFHSMASCAYLNLCNGYSLAGPFSRVRLVHNWETNHLTLACIQGMADAGQVGIMQC